MKRLLSTLILLTIIFNAPSYASLQDNSDPLKDINGKDVKKAVLDNGLLVIVKEAPSTGLASIDLRVKAGSVYEGRYLGSGISHLVEHMIFKGTTRRNPAGIEKVIRAHGGSINGGTSYEYTSFTITLPSEHISVALKELGDCIFNCALHPKELAREKDVILKEINLNRDDPARHISRLLWNTAYASHPYRHPIIGYRDVFMDISRDDALAYYKKMYIPNNMALVLVADVDADLAIEQIKRSFLPQKRRPLREEPRIAEKPQISSRRLDVEEDLDMAYFSLGYKSVDVYDKDMPALDVLASILGYGSSSRLNTALYRKKGLVYSIGAWNYTPRDPGIFIISGVADPSKMEAAMSAVSEEISMIKSGSVTEEEIERIKAMVIANHIYSMETLSGQAADMASSLITTGDHDFSTKYVNMIRAITADDVKNAAERYLVDDKLSAVTISSAKKGQGQGARTANGLEKNIKKFSLANGITCLTLEDRRVPTVSLIACSRGGLKAEEGGRAGISNLTALMMLKGTRERSEEEISKFTEGMGASLSYFSGNNTLGIRLTLLSKDIEEGMGLFKEILTEPSFPQEILDREKKTITAVISATDDNIFESGMELFKKTLYKEHPYRSRAIGTVETVSALERKDVEGFYNEHLVSKNMTIGLFGDIEETRAKELLTGAFSAVPDKGPPVHKTVAERPISGVIKAEKTLNKRQSLVLMGFKGTTVNSKDRYTLQLITTVLSGVSGRLATRLREKLGISYSVGAFSVPAVDPGYVALYILTTQDNIETAKREFTDQIKILNKKGLTAAEIEAAKKELIGNHRAALQTNSAMAHQSTLDEVYGLGYDSYKRYDSIINSITNEEVTAVSKKYLKPSSHIYIIVNGRKG